MAAVNSVQSALHLPLTGLATPRVLMCSASMGAEGSVTLQLREAVQAPEPGSSLDTALTIGYPDPEILADVLGTLQAAALNNNNNTTSSIINSSSHNNISAVTSTGSCTSLTSNSKSPTTNSVGSCTTGTSTIGGSLCTSISSTTGSSLLLSSNSSSSCSSISSNSSSCSSTESSVPASSNPPIVVKKARPKASSPTRHGPQQCQVCSKIFGNASALAKHKLTHSDERKYVCAMCSKAFKRQDHLNGHMLTHRNKKPYECKAEGCGKSYCDARSLRRHTENHHSSSAMTPTTPNQSLSPSTGPPTGLSLSPATASGDASSPHGATCIQYSINAGSNSNNGDIINSKPSSPSSPAGAGNEGLTRQQLDLISQIMQQTKQASAQVTISASGMKSHHQPRPRTWNMQTQLQQNQSKLSPNSVENANSMGTTTVGTTTGGLKQHQHQQHQLHHSQQQQHRHQSQQLQQNQLQLNQQQQHQIVQQIDNQQQQQPPSHTLNIVKIEQKPVECNLCHRKFKNVPALNGHMRLHGGYFKKDTETKKNEKKETPGPPLQTASIGVRALIEEKIISKRSKDLKGAFAIPAAPLTSTMRRLTEAESFLTPKTPTLLTTTTCQPSGTITTNISQATTTIATSMQVQKQVVHKVTNLNGATIGMHHQSTGTDSKDATLIELLKRGTKVAVKRTCSDPGQLFTSNSATTSTVVLPSDQSLLSPNTPNATPPLAISLPGGESTPLALTISQTQNASGDVFTLTYSTDSSTTFFGDNDVYSVSDTAMLLQAVDSIQLLNDSTTADQLDEIASLSEYSLGGNMTPISDAGNLREYKPTSKRLQAVLNSPLPDSLAEFSALHSKDYILYNCTSNASPATHSSASPLPSPLAYPTPPASHEAVAQASPFLDDSHHFSDANSFFDEKSSTNFMDENQSQFFKSEPDLTEDEKILKLKNELFNESKSVLENGRFFKAEDNSSDVFSADVKVEDLLNENNNEHCDLKDFSHQNLSFLDETQGFLDDARNTTSPLSASFFSSEVTSAEDVKQVLNDVLPHTEMTGGDHNPCENDIDLYYLPGLTLQSQMMPNSDDPLLSSSPKDFVQRAIQMPIVQPNKFAQISSYNGPLPKRSRAAVIDEISVAVQTNGSDGSPLTAKDSEQFFNSFINNLKPTAPTAVQQIQQQQQPPQPQQHNFSYQTNYSSSILKKRLRPPTVPKKMEVFRSKLRRPSSTHYTPAPILNPDRKGAGLYGTLPKTQIQEAAIKLEDEFESNPILVAFLDDSKVNIGTAYQAMIPNLEAEMNYINEYDELMWDSCYRYDELLLTRFIELSKSNAVPSGFHSEEVALKALLDAQGQTHIATLTLLQTPSNRVHLSWTPREIELFLKGLEIYGKNFYRIAQEIECKSSSDCIQLYYIWKKLCPDYKTTYLKQEIPDIEEASTSQHIQPQSQPEIRPHVCEMPDCSASFTSKAALHGHTRIHCIGRSSSSASTSSGAAAIMNSPSTSGSGASGSGGLGSSGQHGSIAGSSASSALSAVGQQQQGQPPKDDYPCKVCGKTFSKVKSRSAHMKSHRPQESDINPITTKIAESKFEH